MRTIQITSATKQKLDKIMKEMGLTMYPDVIQKLANDYLLEVAVLEKMGENLREAQAAEELKRLEKKQ